MVWEAEREAWGACCRFTSNLGSPPGASPSPPLPRPDLMLAAQGTGKIPTWSPRLTVGREARLCQGVHHIPQSGPSPGSEQRSAVAGGGGVGVAEWSPDPSCVCLSQPFPPNCRKQRILYDLSSVSPMLFPNPELNWFPTT